MFTLIKTRKNNEQKTEKQKETRKKKKKPKEKENTEDKKKIFFLNVRFKVFLCCHWFTMWAESRSMSVNLNKPAAAPLGWEEIIPGGLHLSLHWRSGWSLAVRLKPDPFNLQQNLFLLCTQLRATKWSQQLLRALSSLGSPPAWLPTSCAHTLSFCHQGVNSGPHLARQLCHWAISLSLFAFSCGTSHQDNSLVLHLAAICITRVLLCLPAVTEQLHPCSPHSESSGRKTTYFPLLSSSHDCLWALVLLQILPESLGPISLLVFFMLLHFSVWLPILREVFSSTAYHSAIFLSVPSMCY